MSETSGITECMVCGEHSDQSCLWCVKPLHRHNGYQGSADQVEFTQCWTRHQMECLDSTDQLKPQPA